MSLIKALKKECIEINVSSKNKDELLHLITDTASKCDNLKNIDPKKIYDALKKREKLGSTGFGNSIAIPHCTIDNVKDFTVGVITSENGIDFDSMDKKPVHIAVFIIGPSKARNKHIYFLSTISRILQSNEARQEIITAKYKETIKESILKRISEDIDIKQREDYSLFHVFVQDEEKFKEIIQIFSNVKSSSISIIESKNASEYLNQMPLFAGFWSDENKGFNKIIIGTIRKSLVNELMRQIDLAAGNIEENPGIMIIAQDLLFSKGSLEF